MIIQSLRHLCQRIRCKSSQTVPVQKFVDLAPTADIDNAEIYFEALDYATNNEQVLNIALTGPYGSGKSSVIKSFLLRYTRIPLQISLASFLPEGEGSGVRVSKQEIERSILQQILYGVEANKLPFSRFKRIQVPKPLAIVNSLFITVGLACAWYLFYKQADVVSGAFFDPFELANWLNYLSVSIFAVFVWKVIHSIYTTSFGLSLKSLSLKDVQIAAAAANEESILNRHLDEILYFFQSTHCDLVVIEDLDRFENPDIFVTLREINGLINANEGITRRVRFLYALRDDIFVNTDRTKFFEFIVPVIPIINHSNSIDKVLEQGRRIDLDTRLNRQFLREVSQYLTDLRLIRNIFNEYVIYAANVNSDSEGALDLNKLLAILIYKNVLPQDFAALHRQEGVLSQVLGRYEQYISIIEKKICVERTQIESNIENGDAQFLRDQTELREVYTMAVLKQLPTPPAILIIENQQIPWRQLSEFSQLDEVLTQKSIRYRDVNGYTRDAPLSPVESTVDPTRSFADRKVQIDFKATEFKKSSEKRLRELKVQLASLRTRKFNEVIRESSDLIDQIFGEVSDNRELLKYLILEGYLDDTYYQYISLFHSGRLSPNDNNFLIQIRSYNNPPPDFQIDNVAEVIALMRVEDFGNNYVLNRFIFDYLLLDIEANSQRINDAMNFIVAHFQTSNDFFRCYYAKGKHVEKFIQTLSARMPDFVTVALGGAYGVSHAARILAYMPDSILKNPSNSNALKTFLSEKAREVLAEGIDFDLGHLCSLAVEVDDIGSLADFPSALSLVAQNGLYRISFSNIGYIAEHIVRWQEIEKLEKQHYSTLKEINDPALLKRINADFQIYMSDVLLALEGNTNEKLATVSEVLNREDVEPELRAEFLKRQTITFPSFDELPTAFHQIVLEGKQIECSWKNCNGFMVSEAYDPDLLTTYLQDQETATALSLQPIPSDEASIDLRRFIVGNNELDPQAYQFYVRQLPRSFNYIPEVDANKVKILIQEYKISFTPENFRNMPNVQLQLLFVATNFPAYEAKTSEYTIDDEFRAKLLSTGITDAQKLKLISDMSEPYVVDAPTVAADIGSVLDRFPIEKRDYGVDFIKAVILNTRAIKVQVSLFNKLHTALSMSDVREVLRGLPWPFQDIATFGRSPKIENNDVNRQLAVWLKQRNIISSFGDTLLSGEIKINTFKKER